VGQADAEHRAGPLELAGDERRAVEFLTAVKC